MASTLINVALSSIRPPHASYYGDIDEKNPVVRAADKEIREVLAYFVKKLSTPIKSDEACSRGSNWLFDTWNKYEPRLPIELFYKKLIDVGDYLRELGVSEVASRQCYQRYLITRYGEVPSYHVDDAHAYRKTFFDDKQAMKDNILTSKALLGMYICEYNSIYERDPNLLASESTCQCQRVLCGLRTFMQCLMQHEALCWLVYNCTIIIYKICRVVMTSGNSVKVVEFLLWAAMCMESSVPLLDVKYLSWRATLYSAVCLTYYDCKAGHHAEAFARRGLSKLQELSELERLSSSTENTQTQCIFRQATAKMASMVFKRSVYETRRKPKGYLRPKMRNNLKEAAQLSWPRTMTERLLSEMFEGSAAQFLAILEALSSSHRRTLHNGPASNDSDMVDVTSELFFAGKEIIAGGGGNKSYMASGPDHSVLAGVRHDKSLIDLASAGIDGVTLSSVVRFIKLAFCYDQWSTFNTLLDCALIYIKKSGDGMAKEGSSEHSGTELCLALLLVMERVARLKSNKKTLTTTSGSAMPSAGEDISETAVPPPTQGSIRSVQISDDLVNLAETVLYCINDPTLFSPQGLDGDILIDRDMIVDASLLLWQKCKLVFGKLQSGSRNDMAAALQRSGNPSKWLHMLTVVHSALVWSDIGSVDPALMAEVCLRLALALETIASSDTLAARFSDDVGGGSRLSLYSTSEASPNSQLSHALLILKDGLKAVSRGRANMASNDAMHVADVSWMGGNDQLMDISTSTSDAFIRDLHVELLAVHHRIALRLVDQSHSASQKQTTAIDSGMTTSASRHSSMEPMVLTEDKVREMVGGCLVSRAVFLMQKADQLERGDPLIEKLLNKVVTTIENAQQEEKRLFEDSWLRLNNPYNSDDQSNAPSSPILLSRSDTSMTFKPSPFQPDSLKVSWYRIFGRLAAGSNVKVRLNDYFLPGAGDEVPAGDDCILRVNGLVPNQRYVFAVAAYTSDGKLIGGSVGKTGHSIVACHPMSILSTWGLLAQVSYKLGTLKVSKRACAVLWDHFVAAPTNPPHETWTSTSRRDFSLTTYHLHHKVALESSPVLLRHALSAVFVAVETAIEDNKIYCDKTCDSGPLLQSQILRLNECERMLVAMEISGWLNDASSLLQAVVQTYGLIAPIIQAEVSALPVLQVATRCHSALQEINNVLKQKRSTAVNESLHHMIAVLTNYIAKFAKAHGKSQVALSAIDAGKQLLRVEQTSYVVGEQTEEPQQSAMAKRNKSRKGVPVEIFSNQELAALEERLAELTRESRAADELTGNEEPGQILARLAKMRPIVAYRELVKFRRRSRFLEFFVFVLRKALKLQQVDLAIEWSQEVLTSLHRRNEGLAVNRSLVSKQPGGVAVQGEEVRKYAAAVVEFSQDAKKSRKDEAIKAKMREKQRKLTLLRKKSGGNVANEEQEEAERRALHSLAENFIEFYRNSGKKKKLRKITIEETPWRADFNHLNALLHFDVFLGKLKGRNQLRGIKTPLSRTVEFLDQGWWSYDTSGTLVVGWNDGSRQPFDFMRDNRDDHIRALEKAAFLAITTALVGESAHQSHPIVLDDEGAKGFDTPRTQRTNSPISMISIHTNDPEVQAVQPHAIAEALKLSMLSFRRGLVLAHRGRHWTLMQNIARSLYSSIMVALQTTADNSEPTFTVKQLRTLVWQSVATAADLLLDMLVQMQTVNEACDWSVRSFAGEPKDVKGGTSLKFEQNLDDVGTIDILLIKKIVFQSIQLLHFETRWEQLVDLCLRFSALTHDRYCDVITPVLIHAQARINDIIQTYEGDKHPQPHFVNAARKLDKGKVTNKDYLRYSLNVHVNGDSSSIGVGGFIDPASHDVYGGGRRALALSSVPFDPEHSMEGLRVAITQSQYMSRALQHSRRLLAVYLASQHNIVVRSRKPSAKAESSSSCVEFSMKHGEPQSTAPPDITTFDFTSTDVVETMASSQLSTVIQSYNRTIELLVSHGEHDLVSQASNELADLYMHQGNTRAAHKWWTYALNHILNTKDSLQQWRKVIKDSDNVPAELLSVCGIWGCLLAISLTCKIGEFTASDVGMKSDCALLSVEFVRAIFRSSLPHPTADFDYASYEIIPTSAEASLVTTTARSKVTVSPNRVQANSLLNGIDLFSDRFRCDVQTLVSSLHWLCDILVSMKFSLPSLPCLTLYQYLATFVCRDFQRSVQCRCLKLTALTELRMYKEATEDAIHLLYGVRLPHPTEVAYSTPETPPPTVIFDTKKLIDDIDNLKVMEVLATKRLSGTLASQYGPHLTCEVTLGQANLLTSLAGCISRIPQKPTAHDLQFVSPDIQTELKNRVQPNTPRLQISGLPGSRRSSVHVADDVRSNISAFSSASTSKHINKLFTKRDRPMGQQLLKGMLLAVAENLASTMTKTFESSTESLIASELWLLVKGAYLLSEIQQQRQLSTLSAAHAHKALEVLRDSDLFDEKPIRKVRKLRSALRKKDTTSKHETSTRKEKKTEPYQVLEQMYRSRLNARLWLDCRLRLCQALTTQVKGLGKVGDMLSDRAGLLDHSQAQLYCAEGLAEAEASNDVEMQALFLIQGSSLDGITSNESKHMLEDATSSLDEQTELSCRAVLGLVDCTTRLADLSLISGTMTTSESIQSYRSAHSVLLLKAMQEGETVTHCQSGGELSTLAETPKNLYAPHLQLLAHIKLRIAHSMSQTLSNDSIGSDHSTVAQILTQAQKLSSQGVSLEPQLLAEIHLELGKIQRLLVVSGIGKPKSVLACLREAIKLSEMQTSDLSTIRQAHLEMAMLDLVNIETNFSDIGQPPSELDRTSSSPSATGPAPIPSGHRSFSLDVGVVSQPFEITQGKMRVATSLHAAYHAACGLQQRAVLPGNPQVTSLTFSSEDKSSLPDFIIVDLSSDHADLPTPSVTEDVTIDPLLTAIRTSSSGLSWIHVLMYNVLLQRKSRLSTLVANGNTYDTDDRAETSEDSERTMSQDGAGYASTVRTPLNSCNIPLRISALHDYLCRLTSYATTCHTPPYPRDRAFVAVQWYKGARNAQLLWCVTRVDATIDCARLHVGTRDLDNISQQVVALKKRTDEFFGRNQNQADPGQRKSKTKLKVVQMEPQLEEDWKHVLNQVIDLFSNQDEPITQLPFDVTMVTAQSMVDLFSIGCCFESSHPLYKWMVQILCPC